MKKFNKRLFALIFSIVMLASSSVTSFATVPVDHTTMLYDTYSSENIVVDGETIKTYDSNLLGIAYIKRVDVTDDVYYIETLEFSEVPQGFGITDRDVTGSKSQTYYSSSTKVLEMKITGTFTVGDNGLEATVIPKTPSYQQVFKASNYIVNSPVTVTKGGTPTVSGWGKIKFTHGYQFPATPTTSTLQISCSVDGRIY